MAYGDPDGAGVGGRLAFLVLVLAVFRPLLVRAANTYSRHDQDETAAVFG